MTTMLDAIRAALDDLAPRLAGVASEVRAGSGGFTVRIESKPEPFTVIVRPRDGESHFGRTASASFSVASDGPVAVLPNQVEQILGWFVEAVRKRDPGGLAFSDVVSVAPHQATTEAVLDKLTTQPDVVDARGPDDILQWAAYYLVALGGRQGWPWADRLGAGEPLPDWRRWVLDRVESGLSRAEFFEAFGTRIDLDEAVDGLVKVGFARREEGQVVFEADPAVRAAVPLFLLPPSWFARLEAALQRSYDPGVDWLARLAAQ